MSNLHGSSKKNMKLKQITYISPSGSKSNLSNDSQRVLQTSGNFNHKGIGVMHKTNNVMSGLYRSSSSNARSQVYSLSNSNKMGFLKRPINNSNMLTTSSTTSHNNSMNFSSTSSNLNYPYNYTNYEKQKRKTSSSVSSANNNLIKSQSSSNYMRLNNRLNSANSNGFSKDSKRVSHRNVKPMTTANPSNLEQTTDNSNMKVFYNELSKRVKSLSKTKTDTPHYQSSGTSNRFNSYYGAEKMKKLNKESLMQQTYNNKATISQVENPEELHFFYVNVLQSGKKVQNKFDK